MNRDEEVLEIYYQNIPDAEKLRRLQELALDMTNELEALDQNMRPELHNRLSAGLMLAKNLIRKLSA